MHTELQWIYDHEVVSCNLNRWADMSRRGYGAWYIRRGAVRVETEDGRHCEAGAGMWLLTPTENFHQHFTKDAQILSVHFSCHWPSGEKVLTNAAGIVFAGSEYPALERKAVRLERMVRRYLPWADVRYYSCFSDYELFLTFHDLFLQWLKLWFGILKRYGANLTRLSADDDRVERALRCLNNASLGEGLPQEALRSESGLSDAHLNRLFLAEYGLTLRKAWEKRRLDHARSCLESSRMPIKEVAYSLGFRSDSHFMMWFKQRTGKRPKEYRQVHRAAE